MKNENPEDQTENEIFMNKIREESGSVESDDTLVNFLYLLMRNELPCGTVGELLLQVNQGKGKVHKYTNGHLARMAEQFAKELQ